MVSEEYERLIPRMIDLGTPEALTDALKLCKGYERSNSTVILDDGGGEQDEEAAEKTELFDQGNFDRAHAWARQIRYKASQLAKHGYGQPMLDLYYQCHLFDAPYWFDSFCIYIEKNRQKEKQFYLDNYPNMVVENSNIDDMIVLMLGGKEK